MFHIIASFYRNFYLIVGTMFTNLLRQRSSVVDFHAVNRHYDVTLADSGCRRCTLGIDRRHVCTTDLLDACLLALLIDEGLINGTITDTEHRTLNDSILLQIDYDLLDDRLGNSERVTDVTARR